MRTLLVVFAGGDSWKKSACTIDIQIKEPATTSCDSDDPQKPGPETQRDFGRRCVEIR